MPDIEVFIKMAAYSQVIPRKKSKDLSKDALKKADSDGNGFLTAEECCKYLKEHKINYSRKHVEFMMKMANNEDLEYVKLLPFIYQFSKFSKIALFGTRDFS